MKRVWSTSVDTHGDLRAVREIDQSLVSVVWGEVVTRQEICAENGLPDVSNDEGVVREGSIGDADVAVREAIAGNG